MKTNKSSATNKNKNRIVSFYILKLLLHDKQLNVFLISCF